MDDDDEEEEVERMEVEAVPEIAEAIVRIDARNTQNGCEI